MAITNTVRAVLSLVGKRPIDLARYFDTSKQAMNTKMTRDSWSGNDLARVANFAGCKLAFILPDGQEILISADDEKEKASDEMPEA